MERSSQDAAQDQRASREHEQLRYWAKKWNVSEEELKSAIRKAGPLVKDVAHELRRD